MTKAVIVIYTLAMPLMASQATSFLREQFFDHDGESVTASADVVKHEIDDYGKCSFFTERGVRWSRNFADGSRLELVCEPDPGSLLPGYRLRYSKAGGSKVEVGRCIFDSGFNHGWFFTSADPNVKGIVRVEWVSVDGGKNDGGLRHIDAEHRAGPEEPYVDVVRWVFDVKKQRLECISDKYQYLANSNRLPDRPGSIESYIGAPVPELRRTFVKSVD